LRIANCELRIFSIIFLICAFNVGIFSQTNPTAPALSNPKDYKILGGTLANPYADPSYINVGGVNTGGVGGSINFQAGNGNNTTGSITFSLASSNTSNNGNINFLVPYGLIKIGTSTSSLPLSISGNGNLATNGTLTAIGNTAIGTSTFRSGCALTVNGKIAAEEFEIVSDVGADFVFGKDYKLRSLKEVENFINSNSHLPEVPSAIEMQQNGYKVAEMNNTLLKKVEELTLYVIELNKQLEATKAELEQMREGK
jgi:hypothetical protein